MMLKKGKNIKMDVFGSPDKHFEALLYKQDHRLADFYLDNNFHQLRLSLLAEQITNICGGIKRIVNMVNLGCGSGELESRLIHVDNLFRIGIDVSKEALSVGVERDLFDRVIVADIVKKSFRKFNLPNIDIVVAAEVLEHIQHPGLFIRDSICPLQVKGSYFVGSVPNVAQLNDVVGLISGKGYSYQLRRPLTDINSGHISFFSLQTLRETLSFGGYDKIRIFGNGVRLCRQNNFNLPFISKLPFLKQFSDRFVFCCRKQ